MTPPRRAPKKSRRSAGRRGLRDELRGGAAYVEFLLSFIPLFFMFLGMAQMALMYSGGLVVQHAANTAARAAVVVLDDDPERYDGAARRQIESSGSGGAEDAIGSVLSLLGGGGGGGGGGVSVPNTSGPRMTAIRDAASLPLLAISPSFQQLTGSDESVRTAIGDYASRAATGALVYNRGAMAVTFPSAPGASSYRTSFEPGDQVTTRVTYLFHCAVPLVNRIMCESYPTLRLGPAAAAVEELVGAMRDGTLSFDEVMSRLERINTARERYDRDQAGIQELETAPVDDLMYLTWLTGSRFKVVRAEATLPLHSAPYRYPSE